MTLEEMLEEVLTGARTIMTERRVPPLVACRFPDGNTGFAYVSSDFMPNIEVVANAVVEMAHVSHANAIVFLEEIEAEKDDRTFSAFQIYMEEVGLIKKFGLIQICSGRSDLMPIEYGRGDLAKRMYPVLGMNRWAQSRAN